MNELKNRWKLHLLKDLSKKVENFSGLKIQQNTPIIGQNAFCHKAGLHVSAVLKNPEFYEAFPAELIGKKRDFILDKMAGKHTVIKKFEQLGLSKYKDNTNKLLEYAKSKEKGIITKNEIFQILSIPHYEENFFQKYI